MHNALSRHIAQAARHILLVSERMDCIINLHPEADSMMHMAAQVGYTIQMRHRLQDADECDHATRYKAVSKLCPTVVVSC